MAKRQTDLLTALDVRNAKPQGKPYRLRDGRGLYLEVRPTGAKFWRYRYRIAQDKPDQMFALGEAGEGAHQMSLAEARKGRDKARELVARGIHPIHARAESKAVRVRAGENTFGAIAEEWIAEARAHWSPRYAKQVRRGLDTDIIPAIGKRPMPSITAADVRRILTSRKEHANTAALLRLWIGSAFRWAIANGIEGVNDDPTVATRRMIKRPPIQHHKPLSIEAIPAFLTALRADKGNKQASIAGELLMLTFVRPSEICGARWDEFNTDKALWIIPAKRMKMNSDHYIPLSPRALELLAELRELTGDRAHLFPNRKAPTRAMGQGALDRLFRRIGYAGKFTPHGCRATASTILNGMGFRGEVIERQLAHAPRDKVRASYNQQQYLPERRAMMDTWANVIAGRATAESNVIPMREAAVA